MTEQDNRTIAYYDNNAETFTISSLNADMSVACDRFLGLLPLGAYIMDLGCGTGRDTKYFLDKGYRVLPVDGSSEMCRIATGVTGIQPRKMRFEELDFCETFDGIWACASLLHVSREQMPEIMGRISRALKPGGVVYLSFKYGHGSGMRHGRYFSDMTEEDIPFICGEEHGFRIIEYYISGDVRPGRSGEQWLNVLIKRHCSK